MFHMLNSHIASLLYFAFSFKVVMTQFYTNVIVIHVCICTCAFKYIYSYIMIFC